MNVVIINPTHPDTPHISAVRASRFAQELGALGHRVVLLTAPIDENGVPREVDHVEHDWSTPMILEAGNPPRSMAPRLFVLGKMITAVRILVSGGRRGEWVRNAVTCVGKLRPSFRPDVVWCTFGQLEGVVAARCIARRARCAWVLDVKDNWELYVPAGMRRLMTWRIRGWSAVIANADFNVDMVRKWLGVKAELIYSGVDDAFLEKPAKSCDESLRFVTVVGSLYSPVHLATLLRGIHKWLLTQDSEIRQDFCVKYFGGDTAMFRSTADVCIPGVRTESPGYIAAPQLAGECRQAIANMYIGHHAGFHHKLLELLACGRPVIACPGASGESRRLALQVGGELYEAASEAQVAESLTRAFAQRLVSSVRKSMCVSPIEQYSWPNQALRLESVLAASIKGGV